MNNHYVPRSVSKRMPSYLLSTAVVAASLATPTMVQAQSSLALEEVVVTAQRRNESLQDVPISVTAITADDLASKGIAGTGASR